MTVEPLLWLLGFVLIVSLIYAGLMYLGVPIHPTLLKLMIGLVALIVIVVLLFWLFGLLGYTPAREPFRR
jgi:hypothetical protein